MSSIDEAAKAAAAPEPDLFVIKTPGGDVAVRQAATPMLLELVQRMEAQLQAVPGMMQMLGAIKHEIDRRRKEGGFGIDLTTKLKL